MFSAAIRIAQLFLVFFPFGSLNEYVLGWPLGLSLTANAILAIASTLGRRDQHVRVSLTGNGIQYDDESESYRRNELLLASEIKKIRTRRNPFFKSLTIDMKEDNQRFCLSNASFTENFLAEANTLIKQGTSNASQANLQKA